MYNVVVFFMQLGVAIASLFNEKVRKMWKGEHAAFQTAIWKYTSGKPAPEDGADGETRPGRMFLKTASFFTRSQVDPIAAA
jgi:hypothetical protein